MSDTLAAAKAILKADATLLVTATGGVWDATDLGRMGLNRSNPLTTSAFGAGGIIKPCIVLRLRSSVAVDGINDDARQIVAQREMIECWFYEDSGFTNINTMRKRVFADLHGKSLGGFVCRWWFDGPQAHDIELDANVQRADYAVWSLK